MQLKFIGTGSAFTVGDGNFQSNMILEDENHHKLLIDCGTDVRAALYEQNIDFSDIVSVYISHLHADHAGGLEWLAFTTRYNPKGAMKPHLYIHEGLVEELWQHSLKGGLDALEGNYSNLTDYFILHPIVNEKFNWKGHQIEIFPAPHAPTGCYKNASYGLYFTSSKGKGIAITTDLRFEPNLMSHIYEKADLIFQDCETSESQSGVHAHYRELVTLPPKIKKKMWLYHYNPGPLPDAKKEGFKGFVKRGQVFNL